jgi:hypothetical protein
MKRWNEAIALVMVGSLALLLGARALAGNDPCAGVNCGSCGYCSDGNCYPDCTDPCHDSCCNSVCTDPCYPNCSGGSCGPKCTDPCAPCSGGDCVPIVCGTCYHCAGGECVQNCPQPSPVPPCMFWRCEDCSWVSACYDPMHPYINWSCCDGSCYDPSNDHDCFNQEIDDNLVTGPPNKVCNSPDVVYIKTWYNFYLNVNHYYDNCGHHSNIVTASSQFYNDGITVSGSGGTCDAGCRLTDPGTVNPLEFDALYVYTDTCASPPTNLNEDTPNTWNVVVTDCAGDFGKMASCCIQELNSMMEICNEAEDPDALAVCLSGVAGFRSTCNSSTTNQLNSCSAACAGS